MTWNREREWRLSKMKWRRKMGDWGGMLLALEATGILNQDAEPGGKTLIDACNGFNKLIRLAMLRAARHH